MGKSLRVPWSYRSFKHCGSDFIFAHGSYGALWLSLQAMGYRGHSMELSEDPVEMDLMSAAGYLTPCCY